MSRKKGKRQLKKIPSSRAYRETADQENPDARTLDERTERLRNWFVAIRVSCPKA